MILRTAALFLATSLVPQIFGGQPEPEKTAVLLLRVTLPGGGEASCTATLVSPNLVLTARHCVAPVTSPGISCLQLENVSATNWEPGSVALKESPDSPDLARGKAIFTPPGRQLCDGDVALILLDRDVTAVPTAPVRVESQPQMGSVLTVVGRGVTAPGGHDTGLAKSAKAAVIGRYPGDLGILAPICPGDSGGPAFDAHGNVVGVISRTEDYCKWAPGFLASTANLTYLFLQAEEAGAKPAKLVEEPLPEPAGCAQ